MSTPLPRAAIVYHPQRTSLERLKRIVAAEESLGGWSSSLWLATEEGRPASELVDQAIGAAVDLVVAAGGDGTVREVGAALRGQDTPLGIIPTGTANLLARNLGLPLYNAVAAAHIAFGGVGRTIDVGVMDYRLANGTVGEHPYLVIAGFGIDADMVRGTDPLVKKRIGWLAYVAPILKSLNRTSGSPVAYTLDGAAEVSSRLHTMVVGNCGTLTAGLRLLPDAIMDDGVLDVLTVRSFAGRDRRSIVRWLRPYNSPLVRTPSETTVGVHEDAFGYERAREVTMTFAQPTVLQADGDLVGSAVSAQFRVEPLAVTVRVASAA